MATDPHEPLPMVPAETPLTDINHQESGARCSSITPPRSRFSPVILIIPIAIICRLAIMLPSTTNFRILEVAACRFWYYLHDPEAIPPSGRIPDELCSIADVNQYYAAMASILALGDGVGTVLGCGAASYFGSRVGRKPVLLGVLAIAMAGQLSTVISQLLNGWLEFAFFFLWAVCQSIGSVATTTFVVNMYIVDISEAEERTAALSKVAGWAALGAALSFSLGGSITTQSHSTLTVYLVSLAVVALACVYIVLVLPESFPISKRDELRCRREEETLTAPRSWAKEMQSSLAVILEPLWQLKPTYNPSTGELNWRLVYCAIHVFIVTVADGYAVLAMILFFTTRYQYTPAETGYVLTTLNITGVFVLTAIIPWIVRHLRPLYKRKQRVELPQDNLTLDSDGGSSSPNLGNIDPETSDPLDVHITIGSWVVESLAYIAVAATTTLASQLAAVVCIGFGAGRVPVFCSLVAATVDPLKQGEAMASIEMVASMGMILSPIIMGSILTSTIATMPQIIFYVHAAIILAGSSVLFLLRDGDRFQKPAIVLEGDD
ncbi:MFS general substrate transporter [Phlegmacium glaucopus]|nr:MFS general substrate transporter [Phlegmacium glaucopus]